MDVGQRSRVDALKMAAASPCACQGQWLGCVMSALVLNGINIAELCNDVLTALCQGRSETTPVVVLAGRSGGEGKSMFFRPLHNVFDGEGLVLGFPDKTNFSLLDLPMAKVALLDEFRFDGRLVPWSTLLLWLDGGAVPCGRPQNVPGQSGHITCKGTAPLFVTTKLEDIDNLAYWAQLIPATDRPWGTEASMLLRRLKVYPFEHRVPKPAQQLPSCKHCFANMIFTQAANWHR